MLRRFMVVSVAAALASCGIKGPLRLPPEKPAPAEAPAATPDASAGTSDVPADKKQ